MGNVNRLASGFGSVKVAQRDQLYVRPHDIEILADPGASPLQARVQHVFSAGSVGTVALERLDTQEPLEAEVSRAELDELQLQPGQEVGLRFRHIRLFEKSQSGELELVERA